MTQLHVKQRPYLRLIVLDPILLPARSPLRPAVVQMSLHCGMGSWYSDLRRMVLEPVLEAQLAALREKQQPIRDNLVLVDFSSAKCSTLKALIYRYVYPLAPLMGFNMDNKIACLKQPSQCALCCTERQ